MSPMKSAVVGLAVVSAVVPLTAGVLVWRLSTTTRGEERAEVRAFEVSYQSKPTGRLIRESEEKGPPVQPAGTTVMSVRITPDAGTAGRDVTGYKVMVLVNTKSEKKQKEVVVPVVVGALVMSVEPTGSASGEVLVSLAVPMDQSELLTYAVDSGASLQLKVPPCGGWLPRESDSQVFLAAVTTTDELLAILFDD